MKIFLSGKITGEDEAAYKHKFLLAEYALKDRGHVVMNPAVLPAGFDHGDYMAVTLAMQDICDCTLFLPDWSTSRGALIEHQHAIDKDQPVYFDIEDIPYHFGARS